MIQLSGKIDGGFPFQAVTNGSACSVGAAGLRVTAATQGFAWLVSVENPTAEPHTVDLSAFFKWPNISRSWDGKQSHGPTLTVETNQTGIKAYGPVAVQPGQTVQVDGPFWLVGDMDADGDVDASDLAIALGKAMSGVELAKLLGNWGPA